MLIGKRYKSLHLLHSDRNSYSLSKPCKCRLGYNAQQGCAGNRCDKRKSYNQALHICMMKVAASMSILFPRVFKKRFFRFSEFCVCKFSHTRLKDCIRRIRRIRFYKHLKTSRFGNLDSIRFYSLPDFLNSQAAFWITFR